MNLSNNAFRTARRVTSGLSLALLALAPAAWADTAIFNTPGTNNWVVPANVSSVTIECRGAGGAGGGANKGTSANGRAGGGAGGSYARTVLSGFTAGITYKVIVGAGGVNVDPFVADTVQPEQKGGDSIFMDSGFTTEYAKAVGGAGGVNSVGGNKSGGLGSTDGCIGEVLFAGGNGGNGGGGGSGGGGGGAGDANAGGNGVAGQANSGGLGGAVGGGNGGNGVGTTAPAGNPGFAPGGGGGGAANNSATNRFGGSGGAGSVLLTYFAASPTPIVTAPSATAITNTSATLGANVVTNGGSAITSYGIVYAQTSLNNTPQVGGSFVTQLVKGTTDTLGEFTTNATGLTPATQYSYRGYAANASGIGHSPVATFTTLANEPTVQASGVTITSAQRSYFSFTWTRGNGQNCIVLIKAGAAVDAAPVDGTNYTAAVGTWNSGSQIGTGNYVAYVGSSNSVTLAGLTAGTIYHVAVFEVNGTGGSENFLTTSPATGNGTVVPNTYYSFNNNSCTALAAWTTATNGSGNVPTNFTSGDIFIIQSGSTYTNGGTNWTVSGGAKLIINSGGTLDMGTNLLNLGGSFVNNGTFSATNPVTFTASGTITLGTNFTASVLAIGGGGGGGGARTSPGTGGGGGGGASAYNTNLVLQGGQPYQVTVGSGGNRGGGAGNPNGNQGGPSQFGGGFLTTIIANGGSGGQGWSGAGGVGGAGGVAGATGNAANFAGGDASIASISGGGGGGGAGGAAAGASTDTGSGGAGGAGSLAQGGAGGSITTADGDAGSAPGGGGAGGTLVSSSAFGGVGGAGRVHVLFQGTAAPLATLSYNYRSRASGDWSDFNTWRVDKGAGFVDTVSGETPNSGHNSVEIMNSHTVTVSAPAVTVRLKVNTGGVLTVNGGGLAVSRPLGQTNANNLTVEGTLNLDSENALILGNNTTNLVAAGGALNQTALNGVTYGTGVLLTVTGRYVQNVVGSGVIPVATWGVASTCRIDSTFISSVTSGTQLNYGQAFGNFIWNAQGGTTHIIRSMANNAITTWTVAGTLTIEDTIGTAARLETTSGGVNTIAANAAGITMTGGSLRTGGANSPWTVNGPISLSAGELDTGASSIDALGSVSITGTADVTGGGSFRFATAGAQSWTVTTPNELTGPAWVVNSGTMLTLGSASTCIIDDLTVNGSLAISGNSTLLVNGGANPNSTNSGTITVASGSTLGGSGSIGASITLSPGAFMTNNAPGGLLTVTNGLALNGNTIYVATGNPLAPGDYLLITNTSAGNTGSFGSVVISGAGLEPNTTSNVVTTAGAVTLQVSAIVLPPVITSTVLDGSNLIISGTNATGTAGGTYYVRATNNVAAPLASWPRISTNTYGVGGAFAVTNQMLPGVPVNFYRIEH